MRVLYYKSPSGRVPVADFIREQEPRLRAAILDALDLIREAGLGAAGVSFRQIRGKLWEIRVHAGGPVRIFYVVRTAEEMILLHGYRKQSQRAPVREIEVAERRMQEVLK